MEQFGFPDVAVHLGHNFHICPICGISKLIEGKNGNAPTDDGDDAKGLIHLFK